MPKQQIDFFAETPKYPEGFRYQSDLISPGDERALVDQIRTLPLKEFEFHGFLGKRRVKSFGWRYDYDDERLKEAEPLPDFILPLRERAAQFAGLSAEDIQHVLFTE